MRRAVTEQTERRPVAEQINKTNRKSKEADATELDGLLARRGSCRERSENSRCSRRDGDAEKRERF